MVMFPFKISCCFQLVMNLGMNKARVDPWLDKSDISLLTILSSVGMD